MTDQSGTLTKWLYGKYPSIYDHYLLMLLPPNFVGILTYESLGWLSVIPIDATTSLV